MKSQKIQTNISMISAHDKYVRKRMKKKMKENKKNLKELFYFIFY